MIQVVCLAIKAVIDTKLYHNNQLGHKTIHWIFEDPIPCLIPNSIQDQTWNRTLEGHLILRSGAGRGGCQERSSVIYGRLLLAYLCVRHGIGLRSLVGFLVLNVLSSSLDSSTNQPLNLSLFAAFWLNLFIKRTLLCLNVCMFVCFNALS